MAVSFIGGGNRSTQMEDQELALLCSKSFSVEETDKLLSALKGNNSYKKGNNSYKGKINPIKREITPIKRELIPIKREIIPIKGK